MLKLFIFQLQLVALIKVGGIYPKMETGPQSCGNIATAESIQLHPPTLKKPCFCFSQTPTCFFNVCAFLVHGGAQRRGADVQHTDLIHAGVKHPQCVLLLLVIMTQDLTIDEGGEHLRLQEAGQEGQVGLRLVRQEGGLHTHTHVYKGGLGKRTPADLQGS